MQQNSRQQVRHDLTRDDCRKMGFSGIRHDRIIDQFEIWKLGILQKEVSATQGKGVLDRAFEEVFGLPEGSIQ